jgi:TonB family protein
MLEQTTRRHAGTNWVSAAYEKDRSRLFFALVLLVVALAVLLVKDREFWFGDGEAQVADETQPEWIPNKVLQVPAVPAAPAAKANKQVAAAKSSVAPTASRRLAATGRTVIPSLQVKVVSSDAHGTVHLGNDLQKVELPADSMAAAEGSSAAVRKPATVAAERVQMSVDKTEAQARRQPIESSYPLLSRQMKVQGSVLLKALIGADGIIRDLRVLSGPAILASAAREAASRWQFKPYLQNGQAVETQANITVNFTIKVLDNGARDQMDTVVALSTHGE